MITAEGDAVGTICVIDKKPRRLPSSSELRWRRCAMQWSSSSLAPRLMRLFDSAETELYHLDFTAGRITFCQ